MYIKIITYYYALLRITSTLVFANFDCIMSAGKASTPNESYEHEHQDICDEILLEILGRYVDRGRS